MMSTNQYLRVLTSCAMLSLSAAASAVPIGGVEFPQGAVSFADSVVTYTPGLVGINPTDPHRGANNALGIPNYNGVNGCASQAACTFVSLGDGGSIVLRFLDNVLTGSDSNAPDLWVFEVGPDVEDTFVDVSTDGITWHSVGAVGGSTAGVDIDFYGHGSSSAFAYIRLTDDTLLDGQNGATVGADIDAVGAITTRRVTQIPEPGSLALLVAAFAALMLVSRRRT